MTSLQKFFINMSGVYPPALEIQENRHLIGWYIGLTFTMCFSVAWAAFACGYTIYNIEPNIPATTIGALAIAAFIFNMERTIIFTPKTGIFKQDAKVLLPRILLTTILNIGFAYSVEIFLFRNRVDKEVQNIIQNDFAACEKEVDTQLDKLNKQLSVLDNDLANRRKVIYNSDAQLSELIQKEAGLLAKNDEIQTKISDNNTIIGSNTKEEEYYDKDSEQTRTRNRKNGTAITKTSENAGLNRQIRDNKREVGTLKTQMAERKTALKPQIDALETSVKNQRESITAKIKDITDNRKANVEACKQEKLANVDFWTKTEALDNIKKQGDMRWKIYFVLLILWSLDSIVVLLKAWSSKNGYDEHMLTLEYKSKVKCQVEISEINDTINEKLEELHQTLVANRQIALQVNTERLQAELAANQRLTELAAEKAFLLAEAMVEKWFQEEITKINQTNGQPITGLNGRINGGQSLSQN